MRNANQRSEPVVMTAPSLDVYWPKDFVGRTLTSHPLEARGDVLWCRTCDEAVENSGLHLMVELLDGVEGLKPFTPPVPEEDRRESAIGFEVPGFGSRGNT